MPESHKISTAITIALLFLLPVFFIPGGALGIDVAKTLLAVLGFIIIFLAYMWEVWREGKLNVSLHWLLATVVLLPIVYLISSFLATPSSLSLLGYNFEVGTFGFMLLGSLMLILSATIFRDSSRVFQAQIAFFISISLVALLILVKVIFGGDVLVLGNFTGNMGNPIGGWTDLSFAFGLLAAFSALALGMIPMRLSYRVLAYITFFVGTALLFVISFFVALALSLVVSILLFLYFWRIEKHFLSTAPSLPQASSNFFFRPTFLPILLGIVSLIGLINPTISASQGKLSDVVSRTFKIENTDVRPSLSATLDVSKEVLSKGGFLGSGPNTFGRDWLIYKSVDINTTPFWSVAFPFGVGFIPTQIASIGIIGTALWLAFFVLLVILGIKALSRAPESRISRFTIVSALLATFYLWISSFLYAPSATLLIFAFVFVGLLISAMREAGIISSRVIHLKQGPQARSFSLFLIVILVLGALYLGWISCEKTIAAYHFEKAINLSNTNGASLNDIEAEIDKAVKYSPLDVYYVALSRINFVKAQRAASATEGTQEENQKIFEESVRKSIESARSAVSTNPAGYINWVSLGVIYSALVPPPLSVAGSYESATLAFAEAGKRNPNNPELPLLQARLEFGKGNVERARSSIRNSIALKEDYADAYLMLAQLEIQQGDTMSAITSAEKLALLMPDNPGIYYELGLLKFSKGDFKEAADTFARAISIAPDYANAKYYLGLTLARLGRPDDALKEFEDLSKTNPDSQEVKAAIEALRAPKQAGKSVKK